MSMEYKTVKNLLLGYYKTFYPILQKLTTLQTEEKKDKSILFRFVFLS